MDARKRYESIGHLSDAVNSFVVNRQLDIFRLPATDRASAVDAFKNSLDGEPDPIALYAYLTTLFVAWSSLILPSVVITLCFSFAGDKIDGDRGNHLGLGIGFLAVGICFAGALDAAWRRRIAKAARRCYLAANYSFDSHSLRLIRIARVNDAAIVLQAIAGVSLAIFITRGWR